MRQKGSHVSGRSGCSPSGDELKVQTEGAGERAIVKVGKDPEMHVKQSSTRARQLEDARSYVPHFESSIAIHEYRL